MMPEPEMVWLLFGTGVLTGVILTAVLLTVLALWTFENGEV